MSPAGTSGQLADYGFVRLLHDRLAMAHPATRPDQLAEEPVTLHRVMQSMIGDGLRQRYAPPQKLSHELFVLLMQLREEERKVEQQERKRKTQRVLKQMDAR